jgi:hypothetical protein
MLLACAPALGAAANIQCGQRVITQGTTRVEVEALCGQPAQVDHKTLYYRAGRPGEAGGAVDIEVWTYNFGPDRLMQRIRFDENGAVATIDSLGYGF